MVSSKLLFLRRVLLSLSIIYFPSKPCIAKVLAQAVPNETQESAKVLGDRLIVSINSTPYSQRQMETYLLIRESLRENEKESVPVLTAKSWTAALSQYTEDMIIHQEAHRVGSFQSSEAVIKIAREKFDKKKEIDTTLALSAKKLGVDERTLIRTLHTVLRCEAFRRNKERQSVVARNDDDGAPRWFEEIKDRAVVRYFAGADQFVEIKPSIGK